MLPSMAAWRRIVPPVSGMNSLPPPALKKQHEEKAEEEEGRRAWYGKKHGKKKTGWKKLGDTARTQKKAHFTASVRLPPPKQHGQKHLFLCITSSAVARAGTSLYAHSILCPRQANTASTMILNHISDLNRLSFVFFLWFH